MKKNIFKSFRKNTIIFIDGANLFYAQKSLKANIDYQKLYDFLSQYKRLVEIRIYLAYKQKSEKEIAFMNNLKEIGYTVIAKPLKIIRTDNNTFIKKGNIDIELALDAFEMKDKYRTCVLFSGDGDFDILVRKLQENKKRVVTVSTKYHIAHELLKRSNTFWDIKYFLDEVKKNP